MGIQSLEFRESLGKFILPVKQKGGNNPQLNKQNDRLIANLPKSGIGFWFGEIIRTREALLTHDCPANPCWIYCK
jgi:hypothetical protein